MKSKSDMLIVNESSLQMDIEEAQLLHPIANQVIPPNTRRRNIFLSHSGAQKDFAEQLCEDLERDKQFPFFDKRTHSLPKGVEFAQCIFTAAQECELAVVVVSEQYFTRSKWPMLELAAIVQAPGCKILPLFYGLSCKEFKNPKRRERWFQVWDRWSKSDSRNSVDMWKDALRELEGRNGMEYVKALGEVAYRKDIVSTVHDMMQWRSQPDEVRETFISNVYYRGLAQQLGTVAGSFTRLSVPAILMSFILVVAFFTCAMLHYIGYGHGSQEYTKALYSQGPADTLRLKFPGRELKMVDLAFKSTLKRRWNTLETSDDPESDWRLIGELLRRKLIRGIFSEAQLQKQIKDFVLGLRLPEGQL